MLNRVVFLFGPILSSTISYDFTLYFLCSFLLSTSILLLPMTSQGTILVDGEILKIDFTLASAYQTAIGLFEDL